MWESDWALLGIEPTTEPAAIKKAYAARLKVTRPDDDAEAYQALRGAYERVQQWLKRQAEPSVDPDVMASTTVEPEASLPPEDRADAQDEEALPASAADVVRQLHQLWQAQGDPALLAEWPAIHAALDAQPLARRAEWSAHFACWVATHEALPDAFVFALDGYFGWQQDFRVERQIGPQLAQAVQQALLARRSEAQQPSTETQELARPLQQFGRLLGQGGIALWIAFLLQPLLTRLMGSLHPRTLGQCGIDPLLRRALEKQLRIGWMLRLGGLCGPVFAVLLFFAGDSDLAATRMMAWGALSLLGLGVSHYLGLFMHFGVSLQRPDRPPLALPLQRWRRHRWQPICGLAGLGAVIVVAAFMGDWDVTAGAPWMPIEMKVFLQLTVTVTPWLMLWAGAALAWPLNPAISPVCVGLLFPIAGALFGWASASDPWAAVMAVALLYVLVGAARFEERVSDNIILNALCRPVTNTLALAQRWGGRFAMVPSVLTLACLFTSRPPPTVSSLMLVWVAATLGLFQLQRRAETWALARLSRA